MTTQELYHGTSLSSYEFLKIGNKQPWWPELIELAKDLWKIIRDDDDFFNLKASKKFDEIDTVSGMAAPIALSNIYTDAQDSLISYGSLYAYCSFEKAKHHAITFVGGSELQQVISDALHVAEVFHGSELGGLMRRHSQALSRLNAPWEPAVVELNVPADRLLHENGRPVQWSSLQPLLEEPVIGDQLAFRVISFCPDDIVKCHRVSL